MIQRLAEHSVRVDLLPEAPLVLDVGARGFDFTRAVLALRPKARVIALDPSPDVEAPGYPNCEFFPCALVGNEFPEVHLAVYPHHRSANHLVPSQEASSSCVTVATFSIKDFSVDYWDLVKLDCEGSEFDILRHWPGPIASQISVEFHDGLPGAQWIKPIIVVAHLAALGYVAVQHEATAQEPGVGHWDSLFVLKSLL